MSFLEICSGVQILILDAKLRMNTMNFSELKSDWCEVHIKHHFWTHNWDKKNSRKVFISNRPNSPGGDLLRNYYNGQIIDMSSVILTESFVIPSISPRQQGARKDFTECSEYPCWMIQRRQWRDVIDVTVLSIQFPILQNWNIVSDREAHAKKTYKVFPW